MVPKAVKVRFEAEDWLHEAGSLSITPRCGEKTMFQFGPRKEMILHSIGPKKGQEENRVETMIDLPSIV